MATRMDFSLPAAGEATGISIFMASMKAISSPSPTLLPASKGSAHTRPATSVTILISGIPLSGTVGRTISSRERLFVVAADFLREFEPEVEFYFSWRDGDARGEDARSG